MALKTIEIKVLFEKVEYVIQADPTMRVKDLKTLIKQYTKVREDLQCLVVRDHLLKNDESVIQGIFDRVDKVKLYLIGKTLTSFLSSHEKGTESQILHDLEIDQKFSYSAQPFDDGSYMIVKEIVKDGSCLYSAIQYAIYQEEGNGDELRKIVKDLLQTEDYEEFKNSIDQPLDEYFHHLLVSKVWGGEVEISILAKFFKTRICVFNMQTSFIQFYGSESCSKLFYLLYTGSHYNLIIRNFLDGDKDMDVTLFQNESQLNGSLAFSASESFRLKCEYEEQVKFHCEICNRVFEGKSLSSFHHQETGHNVRSIC